MHQKRHFPRSGVLTIFFDLWIVPGRRVTGPESHGRSLISPSAFCLLESSDRVGRPASFIPERHSLA